ncbi:MAG TPA: hypothetical protein VMI56_12810 [Reyranella sp.]|nr:hypothetical protein [Reyranella sp.]
MRDGDKWVHLPGVAQMDSVGGRRILRIDQEKLRAAVDRETFDQIIHAPGMIILPAKKEDDKKDDGKKDKQEEPSRGGPGDNWNKFPEYEDNPPPPEAPLPPRSPPPPPLPPQGTGGNSGRSPGNNGPTPPAAIPPASTSKGDDQSRSGIGHDSQNFPDVDERHRIGAVARKIAEGHAFSKHVIKKNEYPEISSREEFVRHVENAMTNATETRELDRGRKAYWHAPSGTVVIEDPANPDGGTAFRPDRGKAYFDELDEPDEQN